MEQSKIIDTLETYHKAIIHSSDKMDVGSAVLMLEKKLPFYASENEAGAAQTRL